MGCIRRPAVKGKKRYHIEFDIELEDNSEITLNRIKGWVRVKCGDKGRLRRDNPLYDKTLDPLFKTIKVTPE